MRGDLLLGELLHVGVGEHLLGLVPGRPTPARTRCAFLRKRPLARRTPWPGGCIPSGRSGTAGSPILACKLLVGLDDLYQLLPHVRFLHVRDCPSSCEPVICATGHDTRRPRAAQRPLQDQRDARQASGERERGAVAARWSGMGAGAGAAREMQTGSQKRGARDRPHAGAAPAGRGPKAGADAPRTAATSWQVLTKRSTKGRAGSDRYRRYAE